LTGVSEKWIFFEGIKWVLRWEKKKFNIGNMEFHEVKITELNKQIDLLG